LPRIGKTAKTYRDGNPGVRDQGSGVRPRHPAPAPESEYEDDNEDEMEVRSEPSFPRRRESSGGEMAREFKGE
jgi:hypothetical protein